MGKFRRVPGPQVRYGMELYSKGSVFATSAAMHALSGHVVARLGWPFAVRYGFTRIYDFRSQYLIVLIAPKAILAMA